MKKILLISAAACCSLASCGQTVGRDNDSVRMPSVNHTSSAESTTTAKFTESTKSEKSEKTTESKTTSALSVTTEKKTEKKKASDKPPESVILDISENIEVYSDMTIAELISDTNTDITNPNKKLDTSETGEKSVVVEFEYEGEPYKKKVKYTVSDTTAPIVLNSGWNPYAIVNESFNLGNLIGYADNYDRAPELTYSGEVDTSKVGSYPITVTVTDNSGNSTSWDMDILVVHEKPAPQDDNTRISFKDFIKEHNYENVSYGIDVSTWQTYVDYEKVKKQGCEFAIIRMGYGNNAGNITMDDYYNNNITKASESGLDIGVYFYTSASTEDLIREQARWIVNQLDGRELDFPVAFDWETWENFQIYGINIHDLNELFECFCDELEKNGYTGMLYSSKNFLNNFWTNKNNRPVWLAHYVDETDYQGDFDLWQASAYGNIDGIDGDVDFNIRMN
ncbi:MAG: glycoside hydrolase family 25 [Ruminococcus sp.]|nr:glycoside hydrolase family 25 [Ruminococcus sp.]